MPRSQADAHRSLDERLERIAAQHGSAIDPGLERLARVAERAGLARATLPLVTVAGTNGKGSTVAMLAAIWQAAGYRSGAATSPHLLHFNERICIDGEPLPPADIEAALDTIEPHIAPDTLTYFEVAMLVSMACFRDAACDAVVLEVGLGGRLDAANLWDADVAVLTSVALDHADWLGTDLDVIAVEKAGIARPGRVLIVGDPSPPASLAPHARQHGIELIAADVAAVPSALSLAGEHQRRNAACAIAAAEQLSDRLPVPEQAIRDGLQRSRVAARLQRSTHAGIDVCLDVAHNPHAAEALQLALSEPAGARWHLVFAALGDKDVDGIVQALAPIVASIACVPLDGPRAQSAADLAARAGLALSLAGAASDVQISAHDSIAEGSGVAFERAARGGAGVLVCGSFQTVGGWLSLHGAGAH